VNRRVVGLAAATVAVVVLWYLLLWNPRAKALAEAREKADAAAREESELSARIPRLQAAQRDEPRTRAQLEALRTAIPDEANLGQFILDANEAAVRSGVDFVSIAPSPPAPAGAVAPGAGVAAPAPAAPPPAAGTAAAGTAASPAQIALALQVGGGYFQVLDFLNRLNELSRLVVTDGVNVASDDRARLTVGLTARMFVRSVPPGFAPTGAAGAAATTASPAATAPVPPAPAARP
jgi:Tfp pilus assembly protein PilO